MNTVFIASYGEMKFCNHFYYIKKKKFPQLRNIYRTEMGCNSLYLWQCVFVKFFVSGSFKLLSILHLFTLIGLEFFF